MPDSHCPHLAPIGEWCRLATNLKCPARPGRVGCPFPDVGSMEQRTAERHAMKERTMIEQNHAFAELAKPFDLNELNWRVSAVSRDRKRALVQPHLDARAIMDRLDTVVGPGGWQDSYDVDNERAQAKCRLTILGIAKEDVGEAAPAQGSAGQASIKSAVADALKRAAVKFGIGRYLTRVEATWVDYDDESRRPLELPALPEWALPENPKPAVPLAATDTPAPAVRPTPRTPQSPSAGDSVLADLLRELRELPGGENAIRRVVGRGDWSGRPLDEKRRLYGELRRAYRELSAQAGKAA
jgi:hypothetical protein